MLYFVFGVNRLRRRAVLMRGQLERYRSAKPHPECLPEKLHDHLPPHSGHLNMLAHLVGAVVDRPLLPGNDIEPLINGDQAFPAMLASIAAARTSISLQTYIFDRDDTGLAFAHALGDAVRRGVEVRVLIDAAGIRYSWPSILHVLRQQGVRHARFLPSLAPWSVTTLKHANPAKFSGHRRPRCVHRRHEYPRRQLSAKASPKPRAGHSFPCVRTGCYAFAGGVY